MSTSRNRSATAAQAAHASAASLLNDEAHADLGANRSAAEVANNSATATGHAGSHGLKHIKQQVRRAKELDKATHGPALAEAMEMDGANQDAIASACGVTRQRVSDWHSPTEDAAPNQLHAMRAHEAGHVHWARVAGWHQLPPASGDSEPVRLARVAKEMADVTVLFAVHVAEGKRDGYARAQRRREVNEAIAELQRELSDLAAEDAVDAREREGMAKR